MSFNELPDTFPIVQARAIGQAILTRTFSFEQVAETWVLVGYGLRRLMGPADAPGAARALAPATHEEAIERLVMAAEEETEWAHDPPDPGSPGARSVAGFGLTSVLPWGMIVDALLTEIGKVVKAKLHVA